MHSKLRVAVTLWELRPGYGYRNSGVTSNPIDCRWLCSFLSGFFTPFGQSARDQQ